MLERDSCYFCTSPFQLFAIFSLAINRQEEADLYIDPQFYEAKSFTKRIETLNIFRNVKIIDSRKIYGKYMNASPGLKNHLQIVNTYFHVQDIAEMILISDVRYTNIFLSSKAYLPRMIQLFYLKKKWNYNLYYFDDGAGTYYKDRAYHIKKPDKLIRRLLFGKKAVDTKYKRFVFSPKIYNELNINHNLSELIPKFWENNTGKKLINSVFGVNKELDIKEKVIILDQPKDELFTESDAKKISNIYNMFACKFGYDNVIIKQHPRSVGEIFGKISCFENNGIPFELYCLNMDMNDKIIISYSSTAIATPKVLFDQEPTVIVLTKLITPVTGEKNFFEDYFQAVRKSYDNPKKFYIPNNVDELEKIINLL